MRRTTGAPSADAALDPPTTISTIRLEEIPTGTRVIAHVELTPTAARATTIRNGFALMVDGGNDQLEEYLLTFA